MTIDSSWVKLAKAGCPHAFSPRNPHPLGTVFIDGQIRLMKPEYIHTWDLFVQKQFTEFIDRWFAEGAAVVVLGFDDYAHVPASKHMTQRKRSQHVPALHFEAHMDLPAAIPPEWASAMRNRAFKVKVVSLVCAYVRQRYAGAADRTVVIDYARSLEVLGRPWALPAVLTSSEGVAPRGRGECDIKGFAFLTDAGGAPSRATLTLCSTDGDFLPIALLQIERCGGACAPVVLHRLRTTMPTDTAQDKKQRYEYVDVREVYVWLRGQLPRVAAPAAHFASLVACTGCDFTQNLPQLGPARLWQIRGRLNQLDLSQAQGVLAALHTAYAYLFQNKVSASAADVRLASPDEDIAAVARRYTCLTDSVRKNARVAERTKQALWLPERAVAHAHNCAWTLQYWSLLHDCPCPLSSDFGFLKVGSLVDFAGTAATSTNAVSAAKKAKTAGGPARKRARRAAVDAA